MPVSFSIDTDSRLVRYTVEGDATPEEARQFLSDVFADADYRRGFSFLGDRRRAGAVPTAEYIRTVASVLRSSAARMGSCRWAVVVRSEESFGAVRMWGLMTADVGMQIAPFTDDERAREWLSQSWVRS